MVIGAALIVLLLAAGPGAADERRAATVRAFRATHPCPSTQQRTGACPGYVVDHQYPLCAGGADAVDNMMWQAADQARVKDRLEHELCALKAKARECAR